MLGMLFIVCGKKMVYSKTDTEVCLKCQVVFKVGVCV
jgi:hypothetical protein